MSEKTTGMKGSSYETERLKKLILDIGLKWNEGILRDGQKAKWIFDLREVVLTPEGMNLAVESIYEKIKDLEFDSIGGPSIAAEPLVASLVNYCSSKGRNVTGFIIRKEPNKYGLRKIIEGHLKNKAKVILIDDAINYGLSLVHSLNMLKNFGVNILRIATLLDFYKVGHKKLVEFGYDLCSVFSLEDFGLDLIYNYSYTTPNIKATMIDSETEKKQLRANLSFLIKPQINDLVPFKDTIIVSSASGSLYSFNKNDKHPIWELQLGESISSPIFVDENGLIVICASSQLKKSLLFFIDVYSGDTAEIKRFNGAVTSVPAVFEDFYFIGVGDKKIYCIQRKDKSIVWNFKTEGSINISPLVDEKSRTISIVSSDGHTYCLDLHGNLLWKKHIGNNSILKPVIHGNNLFVLSDISMIFCLDKEDGGIVWFRELKNKALDFKIINNKIIIGCVHGYLLILEAFDGRILKCMKLSNHDINEITESGDGIIAKMGGNCYVVEP